MRSIPVTLAVIAAVAFGGCGSAEDSGGADAPSAASARASVEHAAGLRLVSEKVPADARDEGLEASYTNAATTAKDKQMVTLFLLEDENVAAKVKEMVKGTVPAGARLISNGKVLVLYAAAGRDHGAEVEKAVSAM
jgi:hypothetical protein